MKDHSKQTTKSGRLGLFALISVALLIPGQAAADKSSPVLSVKIGADRTVTIVTRTGEIILDGDFESRSGHSMVFNRGKLMKATDAKRRSQRVETATIDASGRLLIGVGKLQWPAADGEYVRQGGDPEPQPEPQPRPNPNGFTVKNGRIVAITLGKDFG